VEDWNPSFSIPHLYVSRFTFYAASRVQMARRVILLSTARSYREQPFLEAARRLGIEAVRGIDMDPRLAEFWHAPLGLDFSDPEESVRRVLRFAGEHPVAAVIGVDDSATILAAEANAALGLPHNAP